MPDGSGATRRVLYFRDLSGKRQVVPSGPCGPSDGKMIDARFATTTATGVPIPG